MDPMEVLRVAVAQADASIRNLNNSDPDIRMNAILDFAELLTAAKNVVLSS